MTLVAFIDFETRSACDLRKTGTQVYAEHPTTEALCMAWAIGDGPVSVWKKDEDFPSPLLEHIKSSGIVSAWNCAFERSIWAMMERRHGWPALPLRQTRCSMAAALAMSLPGSLENAAGALGLTNGKDAAGQRVMLSLARPRRMEGSKAVWWETPEKFEKLYAYCRQDVIVERDIAKRILNLSPAEQHIWHFDQVINARGFGVDMELARGAKAVVAEAQAKFDAKLSEITQTEVTSATQTAALTRWIRSKGVDVDSLAKDKMGELLAGDGLPSDVRAALEIRQMAAKASVAKIEALLHGRSADGRVKGTLQYHAAGTGRWGGRRFQPQNLRRPGEGDDVPAMIELLKTGKARAVEQKFGNPLDVVSKCLRGLIVPGAGREFMMSDFSNIEGRVLAWLAGEHWKMQAFRDFDTFVEGPDGVKTRKGDDLYKLAYARGFGKTPKEVTKDERQVGKVMELALGYQGGPGAFQAMAKGYNLDIGGRYGELVASNPEAAAVAHKQYEFRGKRTGMAENTWVAAEIVKMAWRKANPAIVAYWRLAEDMVLEAVANKGQTVSGGRMKLVVRGSFLWARLPSGRALAYPYPKIVERAWDPDDPESGTKPALQYMGVDSFSKKWGPTYGYSGLFVENWVQALARDIMAAAMVRVERAGYPVILTVHDEIITEPRKGFGSEAEFDRLMCELPDWAAGLPIAAEGERVDRYKK